MSGICAVCKKKPALKAYKPFCSKRCADIDLNRWFTGGYAIPTEEGLPSDTPQPPEAAND